MNFQTPRLRLPLAAACLGAALCGAPAHAGQRIIPLVAKAVTQETLGLDPSKCPSAPYLTGTTAGTGLSTHLGAFTLVATDCITPTSPTSFMFSGGVLTLTSATGDQLTASYSGTLVPLTQATTPVFYKLSGNFTVTGGTGKFTGATGSGYLEGLETLVTGQGVFELKGTISY